MKTFDPSDKQGYYAFVFSMAFTILFMIYLSFFYGGVALDRPDIPAEAEQSEEAAP